MDRYKIIRDTYDKVAQAYQDKFMDLELYNDSYAIFCNLIKKPRASVFEIGCGPGNITRYLSAQRPDFQIEAIDVAPNMVKLAQVNNPTASFKVMDCREIDKLSARFDGIICGFCLPYLSETECLKLIKDCFALLNSGGIFYGSFIEGNYANSGIETDSSRQHKMYVYYHQENYIREALEQNNFEVLHIIRKKFHQSNGTLSTHLIFIAQKGYE